MNGFFIPAQYIGLVSTLLSIIMFIEYTSAASFCNVQEMQFMIRAPNGDTTPWEDMSFVSSTGICTELTEVEETWQRSYSWCPQPGWYDIKWRALTQQGPTTYVWEESAWSTNAYECVGQPPIASFTADPMQGVAPLNVSFDASASVDPDGTIVSYIWDFGDGSPIQTTSNPTITHTYTSSNVYTVTLIVVDNDGDQGQTSLDIQVQPKASITGLLVTPSLPVGEYVVVMPLCNVAQNLVLTFKNSETGAQVDQTGEPNTVTYTATCNVSSPYGPFQKDGAYIVTVEFPPGVSCDVCSKHGTFLVYRGIKTEASEIHPVMLLLVLCAVLVIAGTAGFRRS